MKSKIKNMSNSKKNRDSSKQGKSPQQSRKKRQERPKQDGRQEKPKQDGRQERMKQDGRQERMKQDGRQERPKQGGRQERPKQDGRQEKPKPMGKGMPVRPYLTKYAKNEKVFRCPLCGGKVQVVSGGQGQSASFVCRKKHCFDISARGYVNFLPSQGSHKSRYDKELFQCRNRIFEDGFYDGAAEAVIRIILDYFRKDGQEHETVSLLDAGCGQGFYAAAISGDKRLAGLDESGGRDGANGTAAPAAACDPGKGGGLPKVNVFGLDIVKEAIQIACRKPSQVKWMVGNLAEVPLFNHSMDVILDVLTPSNYKEFHRLLKREGILIKAIPGEDYLKEVRRCVADQLVNKDYSNEATVAYFQENMELLERRRIRRTLPVTEEQARLFLGMTPMTFHVNVEELPQERIRDIKEITIDLELLVGRPFEACGESRFRLEKERSRHS